MPRWTSLCLQPSLRCINCTWNLCATWCEHGVLLLSSHRKQGSHKSQAIEDPLSALGTSVAKREQLQPWAGHLGVDPWEGNVPSTNKVKWSLSPPPARSPGIKVSGDHEFFSQTRSLMKRRFLQSSQLVLGRWPPCQPPAAGAAGYGSCWWLSTSCCVSLQSLLLHTVCLLTVDFYWKPLQLPTRKTDPPFFSGIFRRSKSSGLFSIQPSWNSWV